MIRKILNFLFYTKIELVNNIAFLTEELHEQISENKHLRLKIETYLEIIDRLRDANKSGRIRRRNMYWRTQNKQFKIK